MNFSVLKVLLKRYYFFLLEAKARGAPFIWGVSDNRDSV